jgi:hypothetical protein
MYRRNWATVTRQLRHRDPQFRRRLRHKRPAKIVDDDGGGSVFPARASTGDPNGPDVPADVWAYGSLGGGPGRGPGLH